ncbi:MAG: hypothetical protein LKI53_06995 [Bacteroidales bacterium]|jgi:magnesium-transporting ATPase (P-type)|nr:hypothetical protein [Bacteroidales bacterium]
MNKKLRLYFTFYKSFGFVSLSISIVCAYFLFSYGIYALASLFWFKIITLMLIFFYIRNYKADESYFYKNLGVGERKLWIFSIIFDLTVFFLLAIIALSFYGE